MKTQIKLFTLLYGEKLGVDEFGNVYYHTTPFWNKLLSTFGWKTKERRWVIYKGLIEATKVPPQWFGWLHFTHPFPLENAKPYPWVKDHLPNLSGTKNAYTAPYSIKKIPKAHINGIEFWHPRNNA